MTFLLVMSIDTFFSLTRRKSVKDYNESTDGEVQNYIIKKRVHYFLLREKLTGKEGLYPVTL